MRVEESYAFSRRPCHISPAFFFPLSTVSAVDATCYIHAPPPFRFARFLAFAFSFIYRAWCRCARVMRRLLRRVGVCYMFFAFDESSTESLSVE